MVFTERSSFSCFSLTLCFPDMAAGCRPLWARNSGLLDVKRAHEGNLAVAARKRETGQSGVAEPNQLLDLLNVYGGQRHKIEASLPSCLGQLGQRRHAGGGPHRAMHGTGKNGFLRGTASFERLWFVKVTR